MQAYGFKAVCVRLPRPAALDAGAIASHAQRRMDHAAAILLHRNLRSTTPASPEPLSVQVPRPI